MTTIQEALKTLLPWLGTAELETAIHAATRNPRDADVGLALRVWWAQFGEDDEVNGGDAVDFISTLLQGVASDG
jgi:hypothetical protein